MPIRICRTCGKEFESVSSWRGYCDQCRKKRRAEATKRSLKRNYYTAPKRKKLTLPAIEAEARAYIEAELKLRRKYCAGYDADNLSCIQCYENQTACYKGCYKRG